MDRKEILKKLFDIIVKYEKKENLVDYKEEKELIKILNLDSKNASKNLEDVFSRVEKYLKY
jgi:16S rRNA G527 N7-methylase RsmG